MKISVRQITFTAMLTALTVALCYFHIPIGFTNLYLVDVAVCMAGILLNPFLASIAGGIGAFIGDLIFYPQAMVVTLIVRTVQVLVISVFSHYVMKSKPFVSSVIGCVIGVIIMAFGYSFIGAYVYGNLSTASETLKYGLTKLPLEALQAVVGVVIALPVCYKFKLKEILYDYVKKDADSAKDANRADKNDSE